MSAAASLAPSMRPSFGGRCAGGAFHHARASRPGTAAAVVPTTTPELRLPRRWWCRPLCPGGHRTRSSRRIGCRALVPLPRRGTIHGARASAAAPSRGLRRWRASTGPSFAPRPGAAAPLVDLPRPDGPPPPCPSFAPCLPPHPGATTAPELRLPRPVGIHRAADALQRPEVCAAPGCPCRIAGALHRALVACIVPELRALACSTGPSFGCRAPPWWRLPPRPSVARAPPARGSAAALLAPSTGSEVCAVSAAAPLVPATAPVLRLPRPGGAFTGPRFAPALAAPPRPRFAPLMRSSGPRFGCCAAGALHRPKVCALVAIHRAADAGPRFAPRLLPGPRSGCRAAGALHRALASCSRTSEPRQFRRTPEARIAAQPGAPGLSPRTPNGLKKPPYFQLPTVS